jgi:hypothetical protein
MEERYTAVRAVNEVTEEILKFTRDIYDGWFAIADRIDWVDFLDRLDGSELADGSKIDLGDDMLSPAIRRIKRHVNYYRKL